ncbi:restriction endonuclease subunit S [Pseudomonas abyssi]|uniref:Restriction endonuclease n=1 Tax=Pseudomonas abyssi TaxID=170540 RepID=A0A395QYH5_9PSED|nr:restriction endonuclease subunit S [Halopseudomonas gallaeciensis]RGP52582.1 restriction endonuclease [Halopseudomonas gallaeciensis]
MTALLTDNLPLLAGAPNGIKKLRELILELAVRGKLVPQDPNDEPARELLKRITEEKARLVAEGKIKKAKPTNEDLTEISYEIPSTWAVASLGQVVEIVRGITFPASEKSKEPEPGRVACLRTANVQDEIEWDDLLYIRESFVSRHDQYVEPHDIVMSMANSRELVGKVALIGAELKQKTTFGGFLGVLRPVLIEPRFVMALLRTPHARGALIDSASQTTNIANVSLGKLRPLPFAIPPLTEQHRIVTKVDELMALCDRLEAQQADADSAHAQLVQALLNSLTQASDADDFAQSWQRLAEHFHTLFTTEPSIDALKQTLLQLAVMGKLVPQDPCDEPAGEYVSRIQIEKQRVLAQPKARKQKVLDTASRPEPPFEAPTGWSWQVVDDLLHVTGGVTLGRKLRDRKLVSLPYLRVANVQRGHLELAQIKEIEVPEDEVEKYQLQDGDLLITEGGDWDKVGRTAVWRSELPDCLHQNHVFRARSMIPDWEPRWAEMYLNSASAREYFAGSSKQTTNLASINMTQLRACAFPVPPLPEQHRIVAKVDQLMTLCDQLKARISQAQQLHSDLAAALIAESLNEKTPANEHNASPKEARALLGAEILYALDGEQHTGRVKLQKVISLTEHAAKLKEIQSNEHRFAAGPHDPALMRELADELEARHWFAERRRDNGKRYEYQPLSKAGEHRRIYEKLWSDEQRRCVDAILNLVRSWDTARCERVSTLYSAWNDLLIEGKPCSDDNILREVTQRWHDSKRQYTDAVWRSELQSMKQHTVLLPSGFGRRTTGGTLTLPGFE